MIYLFDYLLFGAKAITIILLIVVGIGAIISLIASAKRQMNDPETLTIDNINDKLESYQSTIEQEILSKAEYKALQKQNRKRRKAEMKSSKETIKPRLFVIKFDGDMHASEVENLSKSITTILSVAKPEQDEVLAIIESPGGVVHNYGLAASQLVRIRNKKVSLTVAVDLVAASGGYMMACVANKIIAAPFAVLGSIGVLAEVPNFYHLLKKHNIEIEHHTAGEYKTTISMLAQNSDKGRKKFTEELEDVHTLFKNFVSENRPQLAIDKIATGEAWHGKQCLELGLIDAISTSDDYIVEKSATSDIYEIKFEVQESLKDKLSAMIRKSITGTIEGLLYKFNIGAKLNAKN